MAHKGSGRGPATRLRIGAVILVRAGVVETAPVKRRLSNFRAVHRKYAGVQRKVQALQADLRGAKAKLGRRAADADDAVEALALALANEGQPRLTPLAAFGAAAPWQIRRLGAHDKAAAVHELVVSVRRLESLGPKARDAALAAEQAARNIEAALLPIDSQTMRLRHVRYQRDAVGLLWDKALVALRRETCSAADDGAPELHSTLFAWQERPSRPRSRRAPVPEPAPPPASADLLPAVSSSPPNSPAPVGMECGGLPPLWCGCSGHHEILPIGTGPTHRS